ncbi:hypothetical protein [Trinickia sp. Y13]|uniref:hypothetical protein n=1 Tax=Trinickia sp. Y13 TaxID=2917807 RepID=UPI002405D39F|nr:hypothetical protein [Trinickia sp. Y13]MDG0024943.1 hypothetical protein [Trinickia sp. Y13]
MLNWDDRIRLSRLEVEQARQIAIAPLDDAIADADRLLAAVQRLHACSERDQLIERVLALREERLAIKRARVAELDLTLPENERVVSVRADKLTEAFNRGDDYRVVRRDGQVVSFDPCKVAIAVLRPLFRIRTVRHIGSFLFARKVGLQFARTRGLNFVLSVLRRNAAHFLKACCDADVRRPRAHPFESRSVASRSRILAPVGAPPLDC